ncbi:MAG TPA: glycosyltransferase family 1 protein, partial [Naasia sp.]
EQFAERGHEAMVVCPAAGAPAGYAGFPVAQVPAFAYRGFPVGLPSPDIARTLAGFRPDVLHAASPFLLGGTALAAARKLDIPSVAVYQTDVAGYAKRNRLGLATGLAWSVVRKVHEPADRTLVPSTASLADCAANGIERLELWGRGVDAERYAPRNRLRTGSRALRRLLAPRGETIVGYVGRIAPEKQVERLAELRGLRGISIAIVGDGPARTEVERRLRGMPVTWLGRLDGDRLADAYAAFDVFAHTGCEETFGQTLQEASATGLPVVAPAVGGPLDVVVPGETGLLFAPEAPGDFRAAVVRLASDPAARARLGEAGRRRMLSRTWSALTDELLGHYAAVSGARLPAGLDADRSPELRLTADPQ